MDKYGTVTIVHSQTVYTDDKGTEYPNSSESSNGSYIQISYGEDLFYEIYPEQYGYIMRVFQKIISTYNSNRIVITNNKTNNNSMSYELCYVKSVIL